MKKEKISIELEDSFLRKIKAAAKLKGLTVKQFLKIAVRSLCN